VVRVVRARRVWGFMVWVGEVCFWLDCDRDLRCG
jgi:hypothetical protein